MRYGVFSDIHSNLEALEAVLKEVAKEGVDELLCAGDLVGYGPDPVGCLELLREKIGHLVGGNHDRAVAGSLDLDWFNEPAQAAVLWTREALPQAQREYLKALPLVWKDAQVIVVHGSLDQPDQFHYVLNVEAARASLKLQETPVAFIGHTHVPGVFLQERSDTSFVRAPEFRLKPHQKALVNVGSVGQPRDADPRACYCIYDTSDQSLEFRRVPYPISRTQERMRKARLPEFLAQRLELGY